MMTIRPPLKNRVRRSFELRLLPWKWNENPIPLDVARESLAAVAAHLSPAQPRHLLKFQGLLDRYWVEASARWSGACAVDPMVFLRLVESAGLRVETRRVEGVTKAFVYRCRTEAPIEVPWDARLSDFRSACSRE
mgnify:CR=1 FL=1